MSDLAPIPPSFPALPDTALVPDDYRNWSARLRLAVECYLNPHPNISLGTYSDDLREEAGRALDATMGLRGPADLKLLTAFLWPVNGGMENPAGQAEFVRRVESLHLTASNIPHIAWTRAGQRDLLITCRRLPSVSQIIEAVLPPVQPFISRTRALKFISGLPQEH